MVGEKEIERLLEGNGRFAAGKGRKAEISGNRRKALVTGQQPFATIICCSDSRVPPEHIFDMGLGDIFIVRLAGNILDSFSIGSVEYGTEHLHTPLLVVMGHEKCGAVSATASGGHAEGNIAQIVAMIKPAVERAKKANPSLSGSELVEAAVLENIKGSIGLIRNNSEIVKKLEKEGKLKIIGAKYSLESGKVEVVC